MSTLPTYHGGLTAAISVLGIALSAAAGDLSFTTPQFLPGDLVSGAAAGHQMQSDIARGGDTSLAVWADDRTTPDDYWPFATEGSGTDVYAARIDASGDLIDISPIMINQDFGDQIDPRVAWNGENWLVVWQGPNVSYNDAHLQAVRVAPDGSVLDATPISLFNTVYELLDIEVAGGGSSWVVLMQSTGAGESQLRAIGVGGDGSVPAPAGTEIHPDGFLLDYTLAYGGGQYLITWGGSFDAPRGRFYAPDLTPIGKVFALPFVDEVASDGTNFLVLWADDDPPLATVRAVRVTPGGHTPGGPFTIFTQSDNQAGTCCAQVAWDGTYYWTSWGANSLARVTASGELLDPGGFPMDVPFPISAPQFEGAPGGGLQVIWNNGVSGAAYPKDVFAGRISAAGDLVNEAVVSLGAPAQLDAALAKGDGVHLLVYLSRTSGNGRIMAQRVDDAGNAIDAEPTEVASGPMPGIDLPSLGPPDAAWNGSVFMITWSDGLQIFARRMMPDGTFVGPAPVTIMDGADPAVGALGPTFLVVGGLGLRSTRVDGASGQILDVQPTDLALTGLTARHPHVEAFGDRWLVVWQSAPTSQYGDPSLATGSMAFVEADGTSSGPLAAGVGWRPNVTVAGDRALLVGVTGTLASATTDLDGRILMADGTFLGPEFLISTASDKQLKPAAAWNGTEFVVAWQDKRNAVVYFDERTDIYGARVSPDGIVLDPAGVALAATPVPEVDVELLSSGGTTLLAASTFRPETGLCAYRIGIQAAGLPALAGDANRDGRVDVMDLVEVITNWGPCPPPPASCDADLDGNGVCDVDDLVMVITNWN